MTAVHAADVAYMEQYAVRVAMGQPWHRTVRIFRQGVCHFMLMEHQFAGAGNRLQIDGVIPEVFNIDQGQVIGCDRQGEFFHGAVQGFQFSVRVVQFQQLLECFHVFDSMFQLPLPVFPFADGHIGVRYAFGQVLLMLIINGHENASLGCWVDVLLFMVFGEK